MSAHDVVFVSTADWDNPFWTNKQHVAVELARSGCRVLYIESLGLRRPSATKRDFGRIGRRLLKALRPPRKVRENIWVWSPIVLPWHANRTVRNINRFMLAVGLRMWMKFLRLEHDVLWTYNPLTTEFFTTSEYNCKVYHCVDEIKAQPGMPVEVLDTAERRLVQLVDVVFTTSPRLTETRRIWNTNTFYLPNVADYNHFSAAQASSTKIPGDLAAIPQPRVGFVGAISGYKVDFQLIRQMAEARPEWSIVLIGEIGEGDPWTDSSSLETVPNIYLMGPREYGHLPAYLKGFDVALLPNHVNDYTDSMFPMKFFEYLAAGCPIVSVDLKAIREFADIAAIATSNACFIGAVDQVLSGRVPPLARRLDIARQYTYEARTRCMLEKIQEICRT